MTADLPAWLRAQLAWDEQDIAHIASHPHGVPDPTRLWTIGSTAAMTAQRALAEIEAKRQLLECLVGVTGTGTSRLVADNEPWSIGSDHLLKVLALPYAGRAGYREEWRP